MKIEIASNSVKNQITSYDQSGIVVNQRIIRESFIISADKLFYPALTNAFEKITENHIDQLIEMRPDVLILGTGNQQRFLPGLFMQRLYSVGIGFEAMNTYAACRSYNILLAEGRDVVAGLVIERNI